MRRHRSLDSAPASYRSIQRRFPWLVALVLPAMAVVAYAQTDIAITGTSSLNFGTIARTASSAVGYTDNGSARFTVTGDTASNVRMTVSVSGMTALNGSSSASLDRSIDPELDNSNCAYSLDGGFTWSPFTTGILYQDLQFPSGGSATSSIYLRVGGSITGRPAQQRGGYSGLITVTAQYR